jgi:methylated-DNA-protein-cysteine methyltransferase-like protein
MTSTTSASYCQRIWHTVQTIPIGKVATYGQIADLAGLPRRARLVGRCLRQLSQLDNQVADDSVDVHLNYHSGNVPWHRVITAQGKIAFPPQSHEFLTQVALLQREQVVVINGKIKLTQWQWQPTLNELLYQLNY